MRTRIAALIAAGLLATTATGFATGSEAVAQESCATVTSSDEGICYLPATVNLNSGGWKNTGLAVELQPGTYHLDLDVQGRLWGRAPINAWIFARLVNTTEGTVVPGSQRMINHLQSNNRGDGAIGHRDTTPIQERIEVETPTRIELQAMSSYAYSRTTIAEIRSDGNSRTSLRWERV
ncbi:hypothetical protein [Streptomyces sporangiiformans]|uniref:Uncharacterized protein n=1 Tax=Streptomyces sporangiiformans TaxID=2315329 RepID=A0A505DA32_9ACTN|nr:hypothetical protein [Streptomyces sporangiiformans]TPQ21343.1 hypothetical protein FGD71_015445 [Streptomyces sporangiiformans]